MKFFRLLKSDFQRAICSYSFLFATLGVTLLVSSSGYTMIWGGSILEALQSGVWGNGVEIVINSILPLVPFAISFATEWKEHSYLFYISRVGVERYILSKLLVSAVSGFLVLLVGLSLSVPILKLLAPEYPMAMAGHGVFVESLHLEGHVFAAFAAFIADYALIGWLTSVCAVWFSTYVPNAFATLAAPFMINFTLLRLDFLSDPVAGIFTNFPILNPSYWVNCNYPPLFGGQLSATNEIGCRIVSNLILSFIMGFFTIRKTKRRVLNG